MRDVITLKDRELGAPLFEAVDFSENFTDKSESSPDSFALIETATGKVYWDGVNTDTPVTHIVYIPYNDSVTSETWIEFNLRRFDILKVEDMEERHEFLKLTCVDRGLIAKDASRA